MTGVKTQGEFVALVFCLLVASLPAQGGSYGRSVVSTQLTKWVMNLTSAKTIQIP